MLLVFVAIKKFVGQQQSMESELTMGGHGWNSNAGEKFSIKNAD